MVVTNRIPEEAGSTATTSVALPDMSRVAVARDTAPSVKILDQSFGQYDQQAIRVVARYDTKPMLPEAVVILRGVNA